MSKAEFLKILKETLEASLDKDAIKEQIKYYDDYISGEIEKGKTEKEVLDELGDPRLIAKTIMTVNVTEEKNIGQSTNNDYSNSSSSYDRDYGEQRNRSSSGSFKTYYSSNGIIGCTIAFLVFFIIVYGILRMLGYFAYGVGSLALSGPIGFLLVCGLIYILFFGGRR